ncbi:C40 family peptidase [Deinococcus roseus]|uniref:Peptidase n=1 Tax=Deinococcus roseus TaxID=392414 RepID=A0ABQ2DHB7_9DEIO|nr:LysM peptidoglycan-binding domain-containing C40 family peptidase [Deinococcus roseus]GGJ58125.1 peptidase [Deinococcus roseus]
MRKVLLFIFLCCLSVAQAASYTVKSGDTLSSISRKTKVSIDTLVKLNKLSSSTLAIGQKLQLGGSSTSKAPAATPAKSQTAQRSSQVRVIAASWRGVPYVYGGVSRRGIDCSGFTMTVMKQMGVNLPHSSAAQYNYGTPVSKANLMEGDLVFFAAGGRGISHVGMYLGNGQFIHASTPRTGVIVSSIGEAYYRSTYVGARRVLRH